jgi:hypothetical protein
MCHLFRLDSNHNKEKNMATPIDNILELYPLAEHEVVTVKEKLSDPAVVKYLKNLAKGDMKDLATLATLDIPAEAVANRHARINGSLSAYHTLISISLTPETKKE